MNIKYSDMNSSDFVTTFVTPEEAERMLRRNIRNRPMSERHVSKLAAAIVRGEWRRTGDTIKISKDNILLDGQHRLMAIIKSGKGITLDIAYGIDGGVFDVIDVGKPRSGADALAILNVPNYKTACSCVRTYFDLKKLLSTGTYSPGDHYSNPQLERGYKSACGIDEWVTFSLRMKNFMPCGDAAALGIIFSESGNGALAKEFFMRLVDGVGLSASSPILALRDRLIFNKNSQSKLHRRVLMAFVIKAWNAVVENRDLKLLKFNEETESFPIPKSRNLTR